MSWEDSYDKWKTTPPDEPESRLHCDECKDAIYPYDKYYLVDGLCLCEDCAREWLYQQEHTATEEQCYDGEG